MHHIRFPASVHPFVRPSVRLCLRWSLIHRLLSKFCFTVQQHHHMRFSSILVALEQHRQFTVAPVTASSWNNR